MHDAYEPVPILEKLPLQIDCLAAWGTNRFEVTLEKSNKNFSKKIQQGDFAAPDIPKSMAWCQNSICVGFKRDYYLIRMDGRGSIKELFPTGKQLEPLVVPLADGKVALGQDDLTVVLNEEGVCTQKCALNWTDIPIAM
ncbi:unnamed protein product, partial [Coregonus sp. 'balchen']